MCVKIHDRTIYVAECYKNVLQSKQNQKNCDSSLSCGTDINVSNFLTVCHQMMVCLCKTPRKKEKEKKDFLKIHFLLFHEKECCGYLLDLPGALLMSTYVLYTLAYLPFLQHFSPYFPKIKT